MSILRRKPNTAVFSTEEEMDAFLTENVNPGSTVILKKIMVSGEPVGVQEQILENIFLMVQEVTHKFIFTTEKGYG